MEYEWDDAKSAANLAKHGVDFKVIAGFDWSTAISAPDLRFPYPEKRFIASGLIGDRLHIVVYTDRPPNRRIIGIRKANTREQEQYHEKTL